jgi:hypothetical protein
VRPIAAICSGDRALIWLAVRVLIAAEFADLIWSVDSVDIWSTVNDLKVVMAVMGSSSRTRTMVSTRVG